MTLHLFTEAVSQLSLEFTDIVSRLLQEYSVSILLVLKLQAGCCAPPLDICVDVGVLNSGPHA